MKCEPVVLADAGAALRKPAGLSALPSHPVLQPSVDDYMGLAKRSPSPPEACRGQLLPDWWLQQPSAGEEGVEGGTRLGVTSFLPSGHGRGEGQVGRWLYREPRSTAGD